MRDDGGQAFPNPETDNYDRILGMSLRDWFAGQALAKLAGNLGTSDGSKTAEQRTAEWCYSVADAMLAERSDARG